MSNTDYRNDAREIAADLVDESVDEIVQQLLESGEAEKFDSDYSESYMHERCDQEYSLLEAATLLDELSEYEETDNGLWEGCEPRRAVEVQAAFTFLAAARSFFYDLIEEINDDSEVEDLYDRFQELEDEDAEDAEGEPMTEEARTQEQAEIREMMEKRVRELSKAFYE